MIVATFDEVVSAIRMEHVRRCRFKFRRQRVYWPKRTTLSDVLALYDLCELI